MSTALDDEVVDDPIEVIVDLVSTIERGLDADRICQVVTAVAGGRAKRRRLARFLVENPHVLTSGASPAPRSAGELLLALRAAGARDVAAPACGGCGRQLRSLRSLGGGLWGCSPCSVRPQVCGGCGKSRPAVTRDRHGRPRCESCPDTDGDPIETLTRIVSTIDPELSADTIASAVQRTLVHPGGQRRLAWAIEANPALLTGAGADAPTPAVLRFIAELLAAGATKIVRPACPRCGHVKALPARLAGRRVCRACYAQAVAIACSRCGDVREPATRDADGAPLCAKCLTSDPINAEECSACGRRRPVAIRTPEGPRCSTCRIRHVTACGICGRQAQCETSRATGQPWCTRCKQRWIRCSACRVVGPLRGGTLKAPLCARCVNPDPDFWVRCPSCQQTWQLNTRPCQRCTLDQRARELLGGGTGQVRAALAPLHKALQDVQRPDIVMLWISRPQVSAILTELGLDSRQLTHEILDELPASKTLAHIRSALVATGTLPGRDERLIKLEHWIATALASRQDSDQRRILHGYAIWHHLRRLRQRLGTAAHTTRNQELSIRGHLIAAINFLDWLTEHNLSLAGCTQLDLDRWASGQVTYRDQTAHFIRWAVTHRHAASLALPTTGWAGPRGPHDIDKRWDDARRLLRDDNLTTRDRVAGLLLLLYAQHLSTISRLTTEDVDTQGDSVALRLGAVPIVLPEPVGDLVLDLVNDRRPGTLIDAPNAPRWLFPGRRHGHPISAGQLRQRLITIGIQPTRARSTALFTLATQLPAAILARMLGIHIQIAVRWQRASAGDWMTYAADVSLRKQHP